MNDDVTHPAHLRPLNLGVLFGEAGRHAVELAHGLADDFNGANNRVLDLKVLAERLYVRKWLHVAGDSPDGLGNVS